MKKLIMSVLVLAWAASSTENLQEKSLTVLYHIIKVSNHVTLEQIPDSKMSVGDGTFPLKSLAEKNDRT